MIDCHLNSIRWHSVLGGQQRFCSWPILCPARLNENGNKWNSQRTEIQNCSSSQKSTRPKLRRWRYIVHRALGFINVFRNTYIHCSIQFAVKGPNENGNKWNSQRTEVQNCSSSQKSTRPKLRRWWYIVHSALRFVNLVQKYTVLYSVYNARFNKNENQVS